MGSTQKGRLRLPNPKANQICYIITHYERFQAHYGKDSCERVAESIKRATNGYGFLGSKVFFRLSNVP